VERGDDPGRDRDSAPAEDAGGEGGEERRAERSDSRRGDLGPRDAIGPPEGGEREESGIAGRAEEEDVGARRVAAFPDDRLRGVQVGAGVAEPDRREAREQDDGEPGRQGEQEDREENFSEARNRGAAR